MSENRRFNRVNSRLRCWCERESVTVYTRIGNLGEGGVFLRTSTPLEQGSTARVRFGAKESFEGTAVVVWSRVDGQEGPSGMGLQFQDVDEARLRTIRLIIAAEQQYTGTNSS